MTFPSINEFKTRGFTDMGARPSLFRIELSNIPQLAATGAAGGLTTSSISIADKISLLAKASSLPPSMIPEIEVAFMGRKIKVPGDRVFPNWSITCYNMEDFRIRNVMEDWHEIINSREPNIMSLTAPQSGASNGATDPNNIKRDIKVVQLSKSGAEKKIYTLVGAWPVRVDPITLDFEATNQVQTFDVEFAYDYWEPVDLTGGIDDGPTAAETLNPGL